MLLLLLQRPTLRDDACLDADPTTSVSVTGHPAL